MSCWEFHKLLSKASNDLGKLRRVNFDPRTTVYAIRFAEEIKVTGNQDVQVEMAQ